MAHGRKYLEAAKLVDRTRVYAPGEAAQLVKDTTTVKFDATVEAHIRLGSTPATPTRWSAARSCCPTARAR